MPVRRGLLQAVLDSSREGVIIFQGNELYASNPRARALLLPAGAAVAARSAQSEALLPDTTPTPQPHSFPAQIVQLAADVVASGLANEVMLDRNGLRAKGTPFIDTNGEAFAIITLDETTLPDSGARLWQALADKKVSSSNGIPFLTQRSNGLQSLRSTGRRSSCVASGAMKVLIGPAPELNQRSTRV